MWTRFKQYTPITYLHFTSPSHVYTDVSFSTNEIKFLSTGEL